MRGFVTNGIIILIRAHKGEDYENAVSKLKEKWNYTGDLQEAEELIKLGDIIEDSEMNNSTRPPALPQAESSRDTHKSIITKSRSKPEWLIEKEDDRSKAGEPYWQRVQKLNKSGLDGNASSAAFLKS